jgi:hypothetical protein
MIFFRVFRRCTTLSICVANDAKISVHRAEEGLVLSIFICDNTLNPLGGYSLFVGEKLFIGFPLSP